jgi:hypothetical protein
MSWYLAYTCGWAIIHGPDTYESPHEFLPERCETNPLGYRMLISQRKVDGRL